jgi:hypothetical protein
VITQIGTLHPDIEDSTELEDIREQWERDLARFEAELASLPADADPQRRASLRLEVGDRQARLGQGGPAWDNARAAFDVFIEAEDWENAVQACDVLFRAEQPDSMVALGHGVWLAVTYPINPEISVAMLQHVVDSTPVGSNAAAVAATVAHYVAAVRTEEGENEALIDHTEQLWKLVAGQAGIQGQTDFAGWVYHNGLKDPQEFLPRMGEAVDNMVQGYWWMDRDALRAKLPGD